MPFQNMQSTHFSAAEETQIISLLAQLEALLQPKLINLSPEENKRFGRIQENKKLFVNKVHDYHQSQPLLQSPEVDWVAFDADAQSRRFLQGIMLRLQTLHRGSTETKRLHDFDNYQNALIDFSFARYKASTADGLGFDAKAKELSQFFKRSTKPKSKAQKKETPNLEAS